MSDCGGNQECYILQMRMRGRLITVLTVISFLVIAVRTDAGEALDELKGWLEEAEDVKPDSEILDLEWAHSPLTKDEAGEAKKLLWNWYKSRVVSDRKSHFESKSVEADGVKMKYEYRVYGEKPTHGRSLIISMHGGGGTTPRVNDGQWRNQIRLYKPNEAVYLAPRAPTDTWNLWHRGHIDPLFDQIILDMVLFMDVNPNKVYMTGYSAGGDGVYQLAPRMADRFAAAAMMAGHPNETKPDGLRNLPFALYMGGLDGAYKRNKIAGDWKELLGSLKQADPGGYLHKVVIYPDTGHWMQGRDIEGIHWMAKFSRNTHPDKVIWLQDDVTHSRFYWIELPESEVRERTRIEAKWDGQQLVIQSPDVHRMVIHASDRLVDLDKPVSIKLNGKNVGTEASLVRKITTIYRNLIARKDPGLLYSASIEVGAGKQSAE